jgi:hypothetical protein
MSEKPPIHSPRPPQDFEGQPVPTTAPTSPWLRHAAVALAGLLMLFTGGEARASVQAGSQDGSVTVDGSAADWRDGMTYFRGPGLSFGARNDDEFLYLCIFSSDPQVGSRAMFRGLTVAFGDKLTVQFPEGVLASNGGARPSGPPDRTRMRERAAQSLDFLMLRMPGTPDPLQFPVDNKLGVEVRITTEPDFVYELKVPLLRTEAFPYAIDAAPGDKITVRVDTPEIEPPAADERPGGPGGGMHRGGMGGGMRGGMGGGMHGGMGRGGGGERPDGMGERPAMPRPMRFTARIRLAVAPRIKN